MLSESKKLPWVHNKHNWMSTNLVICFLTKERQRDVSKCEVLTLVIMKISVFRMWRHVVWQVFTNNAKKTIALLYRLDILEKSANFCHSIWRHIPHTTTYYLFIYFLSAQRHKSFSDKHSNNCHSTSRLEGTMKPVKPLTG